MAFRPLWCWLALALGSCSSGLLLPQMSPDQEKAALLWQKGQEAMRRGQPALAVRCYEQSLALDPNLTRNYLSLAAACMEQGDEGTACVHLRRYVRTNPHQLAIRIHLADLEQRLEHWREARAQFEQCIAAAQDAVEPADGELLHCHARLMEIAEAVEDDYHEHLHRGIGLALLARQRAPLPESDAELATESLLCKAAGELTLAQAGRPEKARPHWYLYTVWTMLDQKQAALRCLRAATAAAPFSSDLTPTERRDLHLEGQLAASTARHR
jgi:tetratricopeptide (TPR) repeat protein